MHGFKEKTQSLESELDLTRRLLESEKRLVGSLRVDVKNMHEKYTEARRQAEEDRSALTERAELAEMKVARNPIPVTRNP